TEKVKFAGLKQGKSQIKPAIRENKSKICRLKQGKSQIKPAIRENKSITSRLNASNGVWERSECTKIKNLDG
ncbi:hypothetical protein, partial [Butyrivibrio proteoclasticus]|uniref:hypothetical protein n=1 Tax=Butyrivibrio proteoclasticus TaxID=43305 RepID=UPI000552A4D8